jgi:hypothetical protein
VHVDVFGPVWQADGTPKNDFDSLRHHANNVALLRSLYHTLIFHSGLHILIFVVVFVIGEQSTLIFISVFVIGEQR